MPDKQTATKPKIAIKCENLCKSFGDGEFRIDVLKSIDLQINSGEFLMLVGPSGCGKTTLISILAGIMPFDSGKCTVYDHDLEMMPDSELIDFRAKNIGFVFQGYHLIPTITVAENVAIPLIINGMDRSEAVNQAVEVLDSVGLADKSHLFPNILSGGQQQRVAISRALVHKPKMLICDEPTSALDLVTGTKIVELLRDINKNLGTTFVVVTHDNRILKFADRIVHLDDGKISQNQESFENPANSD